MSLYNLQPGDIQDLHALIVSPSLTITANNALRVAQLQALLSGLAEVPDASGALEQLKKEHAALEVALGDVTRQRDELLRVASAPVVPAQAMCECGHAHELHDHFGCSDDACICARQRATSVPHQQHA